MRLGDYKGGHYTDAQAIHHVLFKSLNGLRTPRAPRFNTWV
jgi:hypothetical protein